MASIFQEFIRPDALPRPLKVRKIEPRDCFTALAQLPDLARQSCFVSDG